MFVKNKLRISRTEGTRHKKRVRQPHNTTERQRQKVMQEGEHIMEDGGRIYGEPRALSVSFNLPESNGYGELFILYFLEKFRDVYFLEKLFFFLSLRSIYLICYYLTFNISTK